MNQSPKNCVSTDSFYLVDTILGGSTITNVDSYLYLGSTDKTAEYLSGSAEYIKNSYTTPTISGLKGGNVYVYIARVTVDGEVVTRKCKLIVQKESDLR